MMDSKYSEVPRQRDLPGALAMGTVKNQKVLPVSDPSKGEESRSKGSAMTRKGAYAATSYMASAGSFFSFCHFRHYSQSTSFSFILSALFACDFLSV